MKKENRLVLAAGVAVGLAALALTALGNPGNMGFCIACFERDIAGAVGLHSAAKVQYVRPEIIGLVLGAFAMSLIGREFRPRAGSSPATRFVLGAFVDDRRARLPRLPAAHGAASRRRRPQRRWSVCSASSLGICIGIVFLQPRLRPQALLPRPHARGDDAPRRDDGSAASGAARSRPCSISVRRAPARSTRRSASRSLSPSSSARSRRSPACAWSAASATRSCSGTSHLLWGFIAIFAVVLAGNLILGNFKLGFDAPAHRPQQPPVEPAGHGARRLGQRAARRLPAAPAHPRRRRATATAPSPCSA